MIRNPRQSSRFATQRRASTPRLDVILDSFQPLLSNYIDEKSEKLAEDFEVWASKNLEFRRLREAYRVAYAEELDDQELINIIADIPFFGRARMLDYIKSEVVPELLKIRQGKPSSF